MLNEKERKRERFVISLRQIITTISRIYFIGIYELLRGEKVENKERGKNMKKSRRPRYSAKPVLAHPSENRDRRVSRRCKGRVTEA